MLSQLPQSQFLPSPAYPANSQMATNPTAWAIAWQQTQARKQSPAGANPFKHAAIALASVGAAVLLHRLPSRPLTKAQAIPTDWKVWAKVGLGLVGTQQLNAAIDWHPKPWLKALETMAITVPMVVGLKKLKAAPLLVSAPLVAGFVEGSNALLNVTQPQLPANWEPWAKRLAVLIPLSVGGLWAIPKASKLILKQLPKKLSGQTTAATTGVMATCARGCTPGGVICLSELSEMLGGASAIGHHAIDVTTDHKSN